AEKFSLPGRRHLRALRGAGRHLGSVTVGRTKEQGDQQGTRDQAFDGMLKNKCGNAHRASPSNARPPACQIGGLPLSAPEKALTMKRTRNTTNNSLAMDAAKPASPKKPIYPAINARTRKVRAQPSMICVPGD